MAMIKISCPKCQSKLKLKDDSKLGKKLRCPKCSEPFIAKAAERPKAPAQQVQELDGFDDLDGMDDDDYGAPPARRASSGSKGSPAKAKVRAEKPAAKSSGNSNSKVIALAVVGVLVLAGGGYGLFAMFGGGGDDDQPIVAQNQGQNQAPAQDQDQTPNENEDRNQGQGQPVTPTGNDPVPAQPASTGIDLTYLPPDSEVFVHARVGEIWSSPFVQELIQGPDLAGEVQKLRDAVGLEMGDFATVTVGIPGALESAVKAAAAGPLGAAAAGKQAEQEFVIVVRLNKDVTPESLGMVERHNCQPAEHAGQTYFVVPADDEETVPGIFLPDSRTVVAASVEALKKVIDRGKTGPTGTPLEFVNGKQQLIVAVVPQDREALLAQAPPDDAVPPNVAELQASLKEHLHAVALGVTIGEGVEIQVALGCDDASGAETVMAQLQPLLDQGKAMFEASKGEMNPFVIGLVAPIVESAKLGSDSPSASVTLSATVPPSVKQSLAQLPMMIGMMMMAGGPDAGPGPIGPGETFGPKKVTGQPAVDVEGVPEGLELEVLVRWARDAPTDDENKKLPFPLELLVILKGEPAAKAYAYGNLKIGTATAEGGAALEQYVSEFAFEAPETQLVVLDRDDMGFADSQPADAVHAAFAFVQPTERVDSVEVFEGSVQLQLPEESLTGTLTGVSSLEVSDAALKKAGLTLKKVKEFGQENLQLSIPAPAILVQVEVQQANGESYDDAYVVTQRSSEGTTMSVDAGDKPLPKDVKLQVTVHTKLKVLEVPFKFEKVSVPPTKQLTAEGIAEELLAEFAKDDKAALTKYSNVTLSVTGTVEEIDKSADDDFRIQLKGRNGEEQISFHFSEKADTLPKKGDKVTLRGTFTSYFFGTMSLTEGEIVSEK